MGLVGKDQVQGIFFIVYLFLDYIAGVDLGKIVQNK